MPLPVAYGTNVHPAEDLPALLRILAGPVAAVRARAAPDAVLPIGLWLPAAMARGLAGSRALAARVRGTLADHGLAIATVNAFPAGGFHAGRVKEGAYAPDWSDPRRTAYTLDVARAIARLVPAGRTIVASTVPGTWRGWRHGPEESRTLALALARLAGTLADLHDATGVRVVIAPEPEPGCTLETTDEAIDWWTRDLARALGDDADRCLPHLGLCADLAHMAVMDGDPAEALARLDRAGVPVAKVQVSAALTVEDPGSDDDAVEALRAFDEPRWMHQVGARDHLGVRHRAMDLGEVFADLRRWRRRRPWRVHFHAPLHRDMIAGVRTTSDLTARALRTLAAHSIPPVLEVETYTWSAVPGFDGDDDALADAIAAEIRWTREALAG